EISNICRERPARVEVGRQFAVSLTMFGMLQSVFTKSASVTLRRAGTASLCLAATAFFYMSVAALAAEPIRIGVSLGLTGQFQRFATMQKRGYELWRDDVNARGGIRGRPVELVIRDDRSDPLVAQQIYQDFVTVGSVDVLFGPYSSQLT